AFDMAVYLVNHLTLIIHTTRYIGDQCNHHEMFFKEQNYIDDKERINELLQNGYSFCPYCHPESSKFSYFAFSLQ
ncbi:hypothetical protein, partial [Pseudobacillus wudalianchiensis]|uniref:hypothetical protein n=1 Tax=Pseudobacillus wudalianchiensis TaxID=1743143 RepID=UPI001C3FF90A